MRQNVDEQAFERVLSTAYELAMQPDAWPAVLDELRTTFRCHFICAVATNPARTEPRILGLIGNTLPEHADFLRTWHGRNPIAKLRPVVAGQVFAISSIVSQPDLRRTEIYREWYGPHDFGEGLRLDILSEGRTQLPISLGRSWRVGPITGDEMRFACKIMPHLRRAAAARARLLDARAAAESVRAALDATGSATLLLDAAGALLHASPRAELTLASGDGLSASRTAFGSRPCLQAASPALTTRLLALIARASGAAGPALSGVLRLPRPSGLDDLVVLALPLSGRGGQCGEPAASVMLQIGDHTLRAGPRLEWLRSGFGLTEAEARLALALLAGESPADVAARTERSVATVRTHLASLFAKTGTSRQAELLNLLARLPAASGEG